MLIYITFEKSSIKFWRGQFYAQCRSLHVHWGFLIWHSEGCCMQLRI